MKKKTDNRKSRKTIIAFLLMLSLVLTSGTFAYWASYVEGTETSATGTLEIGSGDIAETTFNLKNTENSGGLLVPANQLDNSNEGAVDSIDLTFDIAWNEDEKVSQLDGTYSVGEVEIDHNVLIVVNGEKLDQEKYANIYDLVNVEYSEKNASEMILGEGAQTFAFELTLDEPANQEEYNLIANAEISVEFFYSIDTDSIQTYDAE